MTVKDQKRPWYSQYSVNRPVGTAVEVVGRVIAAFERTIACLPI